MKLKHLVIFGVIFLILVAAIVLKSQQKPAELASEEYHSLNLSFDADKVTEVVIGKGSNPKIVEIKKSESGEWTLPTFFNARADEKKIQKLFKAIADAKGELRANDKTLLSGFGLEDNAAYRFSMLDASGKPVFELLLGTKKPRYNAVFLKQKDSDKVFYADSDLFSQIGIYEDPEKESPENSYWASLILAKPNADTIDELTIERFEEGKSTNSVHVRRETDPNDLSKKWWRYVSPEVPFSPDASKIKQFFKVFETHPATKALDPKAQDFGFSKPKWQMKLHQENGEEVVITAGAEDPATKGTFIQVSDEPVVFLFPKYYLNSVDVDDSHFFGADPLGAGAETTEKIFIHAPSGEVSISPKTDKREVVTRYMNNLKSLSVSKLVFDPSIKINLKSGQLNWIEIKKEGAPETIFLDVEGTPIEEGGKEHLAQKRDGTLPFVISGNTFNSLFQNIEPLKPETSA